MEKYCEKASQANRLAYELDSVENEADVTKVAEKLSQEFMQTTAGEPSRWVNTIIDQTFGKGIDPITSELDGQGRTTAIYISNPFNTKEALRITDGKVERVDRKPLEVKLRSSDQRNAGPPQTRNRLAYELDSVENEADVTKLAEKLSQEFMQTTAGEPSRWVNTIIDQTFGKGIDPITSELDGQGRTTAIYISNPFNTKEALRITDGKVESVDRKPLEVKLRSSDQRNADPPPNSK